MRVGNLTNRYRDLRFQPNSYENAFIQRILSFIKIKAIPEYLLDEHLEFTPVDYCSEAMIRIAETSNKKNRVFHLYNQNHVRIGYFIKKLQEQGIEIQIISEEEFTEVLRKISKRTDGHKMLNGIVRDLNKEQKLQYHSNVNVSNSFTNSYLKDLLFEWPEINDNYLTKFIEFLLNLM